MDPNSIASVGRVPHGSSDDPDVVDLSANVNPRVPDAAREAYEAGFDEARSYPPDGYPAFRRAAAKYVGCDDADVVPTAGGLAAIRLAVEVVVAPGDSVLLPRPSFGEYAREVALQGAEPTFVPHDILLAADPAPYGLAVVCTPNNPTGDAYDPDALRMFADRCRAEGTPLIVDEAFLGYTELESLAGTAGVVVARSLTKLFGLPGLRAGFAVASGDLGDRLAAARPPWSLGWPAARVGAVAMTDTAFVRETRARVAAERAHLRERLAAREEFRVRDSDAPFLLVRVPDVDELLRTTRAEGVVLRDARSFRGLDSHVRVAVQDRESTERLLEALP